MQERWLRRRRRVLGCLWLGAWAAALYAVAVPWRDLGGVVDERLRWLERLVLLCAAPAGFTAGQFGRDAALADPRWTHLRVWRVLLCPVAAVGAAGIAALAALERRDPIGVILSGLLAYWAGLDAAFGAVPLLWCRPYRFARPLDPE